MTRVPRPPEHVEDDKTPQKRDEDAHVAGRPAKRRSFSHAQPSQQRQTQARNFGYGCAVSAPRVSTARQFGEESVWTHQSHLGRLYPCPWTTYLLGPQNGSVAECGYQGPNLEWRRTVTYFITRVKPATSVEFSPSARTSMSITPT